MQAVTPQLVCTSSWLYREQRITRGRRKSTKSVVLPLSELRLSDSLRSTLRLRCYSNFSVQTVFPARRGLRFYSEFPSQRIAVCCLFYQGRNFPLFFTASPKTFRVSQSLRTNVFRCGSSSVVRTDGFRAHCRLLFLLFHERHSTSWVVPGRKRSKKRGIFQFPHGDWDVESSVGFNTEDKQNLPQSGRLPQTTFPQLSAEKSL